MYPVDDLDFYDGGRRPPGLAGPDAEAKRLAAWTAAWETRIRCCGITRAGKQCGNVPTKGKLFCLRHGGGRKSPGGQESGRHPLKKPPTPGALHAREMRRLWRGDPWTRGYTVALNPEGQRRLEAWGAGQRIRWDWLSPRVQDFATWAFLNACRAGRHPEEDVYESDRLAERIRAQDRKDGLEPVGHHVDRLGASRQLAKYRELPSLGEVSLGWRDSMRGKSRRVVQAAEQHRARDHALIALTSCESREQAIQRQLAIDRERVRQQQQVGSRSDLNRPLALPVDRGGW